MPILWIIVIVGILAVLFSIPARTSIFNVLGAAGMFVQGIWRRITSPASKRRVKRTARKAGRAGKKAAATTWTGFQSFISYVWSTFLKIWFAWALIALTIGYLTNSIWSGLILALLPPVWLLLYMLYAMMKGRGFLLRFAGFAPVALGTLLMIVATGWITIGAISPKLNESITRYLSNRTMETAFTLDKKSTQSEAEAGIHARVIKSVNMVNDKDEPVRLLQEDDFIFIPFLKTTGPSKDAEGRVFVRTRDVNGHFSVKSPSGYIPAWIIDWEWEKQIVPVKEVKQENKETAHVQIAPASTPAPAPEVQTPAPITTPAVLKTEIDLSGTWEMCWTEITRRCKNPKVTMRDGVLEGEEVDRLDGSVFKIAGKKKGDVYKGVWTYKNGSTQLTGDLDIKTDHELDGVLYGTTGTGFPLEIKRYGT